MQKIFYGNIQIFKITLLQSFPNTYLEKVGICVILKFTDKQMFE